MRRYRSDLQGGKLLPPLAWRWLIGLLMVTIVLAPGWWVGAQDATSMSARSSVGPLSLSAYPRPPADNGLGVHWTTNIYGQPPAIVDYFVAELKAMNVKWVKFLNDGTEGRHNEHLIRELISHDIMPIMRIYFPCNKPLDLGSLRRLVQHYRPLGLYYYELFNEPELPGSAGGWCDGEEPDPERLADLWIAAARVIEEEGGFPGIPSMFPPSLKDPDWRDSFFMRFLRRIQDTGNTPVLYRAWGAIHNYFLNHPLRYPYDDANLNGTPLTMEEITRYGLTEAEVQAINHARAIARRPRAEGGYYVGDTIDVDSACFLQFLAYHDRFYELFGFEIPLISTEGGATVGSSEDPRYPRVTPTIQASLTIQALDYMLDEAPPYYFAFNNWLLAERAMDNFNPTWESWAWYQDREGRHLPVVDALKSYPRRGQARRLQPGVAFGDDLRVAITVPVPLESTTPIPTVSASSLVPERFPTMPPPSGPLPLIAYPRPPQDNGWGIHWTPTLFSQPTDLVDRLLAEVDALGLRWVKLMQGDEPKLQHTYLIAQLVRHGIMPVLRIYRPFNDPYVNLTSIVRAGLEAGVFYYELYNEPNIAGEAGGWRPGEPVSVDRIADLWIPAAREIAALGGYPGLPTLAPGGSVDDLVFLAEFLDALQQRNALDTLDRAWVPLHNYFFNHPLDYPEDLVNRTGAPLQPVEINERRLGAAEVAAINHARQIARLPRAQGGFYVGDTIDKDSNGLRKFEAYRNIIYRKLGRELPIITTEGGAIVGSQEDPRYPRVTEQDVAQWTTGAYLYMVEQAPPYYFAFMPWLLSNLGSGSADPAWENAAWYRAGGQPRPVVAAVKQLAAQPRQRRSTPQPLIVAAPTLALPTPLSVAMATALPADAPVAAQAIASPTALPTAATPVPLSSARRPPSAVPPTVSESYVLIPTYPYEQALMPTAADDPIYPYPRLDFNRLGAPAPRTYRAIILENAAVRLVLLPELGGRIYQWIDKASGKALLYQNPVIKPTRWGRRGWWIGAGGFEWAFPVDEHGFNEYQPWEVRTASDGAQASVILARTDERTGLRAEVTISVDAAHAYFTLSPRLSNPTASIQRYQFWINAMLAPDGNRISPATQLIWPSDSLIVHSASDGAAFPAGRRLSWPQVSGHDLRVVENWPTYLGFFGDPQRDFMGVFSPDAGIGAVRVFPRTIARGVKFFAGPGLDPKLWTDDGSSYLELWGGITADFDTYADLAPGQSISWTERWYAVGPVGPLLWASEDLALALNVGDTAVLAGVTAPTSLQGQLLLWRDDFVVGQWQVNLAAGESASVAWQEQRPGDHRWRLQVIDGQGRTLASIEANVDGNVAVAGGAVAISAPSALSATPAPTPIATSVPAVGPSPVWDPRLDELGVRVVRAAASAGQPVWRLIEARYEDPQEAAGLHHVFFRLLDEQAAPVVGQDVELLWADGSAITRSDANGANFPLYGSLGEYSVQVVGVSDRVEGLGLPRKHHVNFRLTFQRVAGSQ